MKSNKSPNPAAIPLLDLGLATRPEDGKVQPDGFWLKTVWLHNWHAISDLRINIPESHGIHLEGDTGVGKTTILDGILWALIGDVRMIGFNRAASSRESSSGRNLLGYVRGEAHGKLLRESGTAYILLEFHNRQLREYVTIGSFIDFKSNEVDTRFLIAEMPLSVALVANPMGLLYTARELARAYEQKWGAQNPKVFRSATDYRSGLMRIFDGLPERFFETISHLSGQHDPANLNEFIREFLFDTAHPIDIGDLTDQVRNYREVAKRLKEAQVRVDKLSQIAEKSNAWNNSRQLGQIYQLCEQQAHIQHTLQESQALQTTLSETGREIQEAQAQLLLLAVQVDDAYEAANTARSLLNNDKRSWEIEQHQKQYRILQKDREVLSAKQESTQKAVKDLNLWIDTIPQVLSPLFTQGSFDSPDSILTELKEAVQSIPPNTEGIQECFRKLIEWVTRQQTALDIQHRASLAQMGIIEEQVAALSRGELRGNEWASRAYKVRDLLSRRGQVEVLCDLIDAVDFDWQPVIEKLLGGRRFSLLAAENIYEACKRDYIAMSADLTDGVHLAIHSEALRNATSRPGSLAERVKSSNQIARGLLNLHLNPWTACETDQESEEANSQAISKSGLCHTGGTMERRKPLAPNYLVFGRAALERQRKAAQLELDAIHSTIRSENTWLESLHSLALNLNSQAKIAGRIQPELHQQVLKLEEAIAKEKNELDQLQQVMSDLFEMGENVRRLEREHVNLLNRQTTLNLSIKNLQNKADTITSSLCQLEETLADHEQNFAELNPEGVDWRESFDSLLSEKRDFVKLSFAAHERGLLQDQFTNSFKLELQHLIHTYISQFSPPGAVSTDFSDQLEMCLKEHRTLRDTQILELTENLTRLRGIADEVLLRKFFDRLRMEHKKITQNLTALNRAIDGVRLGRRCYQFKHDPDNAQMILDVLKLMVDYDRFNSQQVIDLSEKLRAAAVPGLIDGLYQLFVPETPLSASHEKIRNILLTPSRYFKFDLIASDNGTDWFILSDHYRKGSGGEHQNPLYIVLTATMLQMYDDHPRRPRLVIIDEAFSKAPGSSINGLEMLIEQGLQPILATPIGRMEVEEVIKFTIHVFRNKKDQIQVAESSVIRKALGAAMGEK